MGPACECPSAKQGRKGKQEGKAPPGFGARLVLDCRCLCLKHHGVGAVREWREDGGGEDRATDSLLELLALGT